MLAGGGCEKLGKWVRREWVYGVYGVRGAGWSLDSIVLGREGGHSDELCGSGSVGKVC